MPGNYESVFLIVVRPKGAFDQRATKIYVRCFWPLCGQESYQKSATSGGFMKSILHEESSFLHFWHFFMSITPSGVFIFNAHSKTKRENFPFTNPYILGVCSWMIFLPISAKKSRNGHIDLNSVLSLSYKISFADLRSLFMEHITNNLKKLLFRWKERIDFCKKVIW